MTYKVNTKRELESGAEPDPSGGINTIRFSSDVGLFTGSSWGGWTQDFDPRNQNHP